MMFNLCFTNLHGTEPIGIQKMGLTQGAHSEFSSAALCGVGVDAVQLQLPTSHDEGRPD